MGRKIAGFTVILAFALITASMAQTYTAREKQRKLSPFRAASGEVTFVISTDNPEQALETLKTAQLLENSGTKTAVVFAHEGVRLAAVTKHGAGRRPYRRPANRYGTSSHGRSATKGKTATVKKTPPPTPIFKTPQGAAAPIYDNVNYSGNIMACPKCMQALDIQKADLHERVTIAPPLLVRKIHYLPDDIY